MLRDPPARFVCIVCNSVAGQTSSLLSPSSIGDVNRSRVLQALCDHGPMSRAELAKMAGVTRATIGNIVQALLDGGLIEEGEPQTGLGRVGKPGRPVWFGPQAGLSGAVAVASDRVEAALVNARGDVIDSAVREMAGSETGGRSPDSRAVANAAADALRAVVPRDADLLGIGVAVPGVCDMLSGTVIGSGQLPALVGRGLVETLARRFDHRVMLDNDSRAQALGEKWFGEGRGLSTFAAVQTGNGLGAGVVIGGVLFRGTRGLTGELGHTCVDPQGVWCRCGLRGCWETIATLRWLRSEAGRDGLPGAASIDAAKLVALVAAGGSAAEQASALLDTYADHLAIGLANLTQLLNPDALILHGDAVGGGEEFRRRIEAAVRERSLAYLRPGVRVVLSKLDQRATLLGAAGLVLSETFNLRP
jgi:predicted NBD/HSP70 family sugar kinase